MKTRNRASRKGFTLIEILVVVMIIGILASIMVPLAGTASRAAKKRRALVEMNVIKTAVMEFHGDHRYMPWPGNPKVGDDEWTLDEAAQEAVMDLLTGDNAMQKSYLQIPEKSRPEGGRLLFVDPWGQFYRVGMDRNMDGSVQVQGGQWAGERVSEKVLVYGLGPTDQDEPMKTFDVN
jgi:prepilin-type N-terminal cleavage/methylation domain-containing protein